MSQKSVQSLVDEAIAESAKTSTHFIRDIPLRIKSRITSQCSGAKIDLYCQWTLTVVSRKLKQSIHGQRRINTALNNLPVFILPDEKVQLGWTIEHALRNQGVHEAGYEHLAAEVLLTEVFPERYAARVLLEMAKAYAGPEDVIPHFSQMVNQVHSSNGIFINTHFASLVEEYILLDPFNRAHMKGARTVVVPSPKAMADTLQLLAKVTDGREEQVAVIGGPAIAWFAAVGEWLCDLRVSIHTTDGARLSANHDDQNSQLLLIYSANPGITAQAGVWSEDSEQAKTMALGVPHADTTALSRTQFGGRSVYNMILVGAFGTSFRHLDREETKAFGTAVGSCARILQEIAEHDDLTASKKRSVATYGHGLLDTLCNWLPELRHLQGRMERQLKLTSEDATKVYSEQIEHLKAKCGCDNCCPSTSGKCKDPGLGGYCLPSLTETIIALGLLLSSVVVAAAILPARFGFQSYYIQQAEKRRHVTVNNISGHDLFKMLYFDVPDTTRLAQVIEIYSGSQPANNLHPNLVALAHEGVCVYLLKKLGINNSEDSLIGVTSGGIAVRQKIYTRACLGPVQVEDEFEDVWEEIKCSHLDESLWMK